MTTLGLHTLNLGLKRIKFACEELEDFECVADRADLLLSREFDDSIFTPETIEDIRFTLEMIVLFAYAGSKENVLTRLRHIRDILDAIFKPYLIIAHRIYKSMSPSPDSSTDIGIIDDLPEGLRHMIMGKIYDFL